MHRQGKSPPLGRKTGGTGNFTGYGPAVLGPGPPDCPPAFFLAGTDGVQRKDGLPEHTALQGFEVVRAQFFNTADRICVTLGEKSIRFSAGAVRRLTGCDYVELLVHPIHIAAVPFVLEDTQNTAGRPYRAAFLCFASGFGKEGGDSCGYLF